MDNKQFICAAIMENFPETSKVPGEDFGTDYWITNGARALGRVSVSDSGLGCIQVWYQTNGEDEPKSAHLSYSKRTDSVCALVDDMLTDFQRLTC